MYVVESASLIQEPAVLLGLGAGFFDLFLFNREDHLVSTSFWNQYPGSGTLCKMCIRDRNISGGG